MKTAGLVLSFASRIVASVSLLSLGACCREVRRFDGGVAVLSSSPGVRLVDGAVDDASCVAACQWNVGGRCQTVEVQSCSATTVDGGPGVYCNAIVLECPSPIGTACGRRTDGLGLDGMSDTVSALIALEAQAIAAFERLARELSAFGAPEEFVETARSCAEDERRHVAMVSALAGRAIEGEPNARALSLRREFEVALENAVEGCVRETFGVVLARWQSEHSDDGRVRACYEQIARDEAKHAAFAHEIAPWLEARITREERAVIASAKRAALATLREEQQWGKGDRWLGLPDGATARAMVDAFAWAVA